MFIDCGAELMPIDLRVLQGEELKLVLESCDMIYVSGGENAYFLSVAKQSGYSDVISDFVRNQNKIYMSTSA